MTSQYISIAQEILKSHKFVQLSASWCPDCVYACNIWDKFSIRDQIYIFDISKQSQSKAEELMYRDAFATVCGIRNLPTIFVDGKVWGTERELHLLENSGELKHELLKIGFVNVK